MKNRLVQRLSAQVLDLSVEEDVIDLTCEEERVAPNDRSAKKSHRSDCITLRSLLCPLTEEQIEEVTSAMKQYRSKVSLR